MTAATDERLVVPAIVKTGPGPDAVELQERIVPAPGRAEVIVTVSAAGVCGTDLHILDDEYASVAPVVLGHEISGRVSALGEGVDAGWLDARVAVETFFAACEVCDQCRAGRRNLCSSRQSIGSKADGGFSSHLRVPAINLHRVPDHVSDHAAALCEPLACVCRCLLDPAVISAGDRVLVVGPGAMGQLAVQVALAQGAEVDLAGLPRDAERLALAESWGARGLDTSPAEAAYDVVIECSGSGAGAAACLRAARPTGSYIAIGIFGHPVSVDLDAILLKELTVTSGFASTPDAWRRAMALLEQRRVDLEPLVGRRAALEEFASVFAEVRDGTALKTVFVPSAPPGEPHDENRAR